MSTTAVSGSKHSRTYGFKPKQNIPESQKTEEWGIQNVDWCISMMPYWYKKNVDAAYDRYNGKRSDSDYEHITKTYGIEFPAGKLKHIPLVRPMLNELVSEMEEKSLRFSIYSEDPDSVAMKTQEISGRLLYDVAFAIRNARTPEELDAMMDGLEAEYRKFQTETEKNAVALLRNYIQRHRVDRKLIENWIDKLISGYEYARINLHRLNEDPEFTVIKGGDIFFADNNVNWVSECDWAVYITEMTPTEILDAYGDRMKVEDVKKIEDWLDMYNKEAWYKLAPGQSMDDLASGISYKPNNANVNQKVLVHHVEWKTVEEVNLIKNQNKYNSEEPFLKFIDQDQLYNLPTSKKKKIERRYIQKLWRGIRIGDDIYVDIGEDATAIRSISQPSKVYLNFEGPTFNGKINPYSLINETWDLQDLYDIMHWHKENLIALSGAKGSFMDLSQMPDFFNGAGKLSDNIKMWFYYRKLGAAFINTAQEGASKTYNQFQSYDDTLGTGLQAILATIQHLEEAASRITGVNRQRMGQIKQYDGKSTTENAQAVSSMITEYLFNGHDEYVERVLTLCMNKLRVAYPEGTSGAFLSREGENQIYRLDNNFALSDYGVYLSTRKSDDRKLEELKALSGELVKSQLLGAEDLLLFFRKESFQSILDDVEKSILQRKQNVEQMQQQQAQIQQQLEAERNQAEIEKLKAQSAELAAKIQNYQQQINVDEQALQIQRESDMAENANDAARVQLEAKQLDIAATQKGNAAEVRNK